MFSSIREFRHASSRKRGALYDLGEKFHQRRVLYVPLVLSGPTFLVNLGPPPDHGLRISTTRRRRRQLSPQQQYHHYDRFTTIWTKWKPLGLLMPRCFCHRWKMRRYHRRGRVQRPPKLDLAAKWKKSPHDVGMGTWRIQKRTTTTTTTPLSVR